MQKENEMGERRKKGYMEVKGLDVVKKK
jgi:hypothetical protein